MSKAMRGVQTEAARRLLTLERQMKAVSRQPHGQRSEALRVMAGETQMLLPWYLGTAHTTGGTQYLAWTFDPGQMVNTTDYAFTVTPDRAATHLCYVPAPCTAQGIAFQVDTAQVGGTLSDFNGCFLYDTGQAASSDITACTLLAQSASNNARLTSTGLKTADFTTPVVLAPGFYYLGFQGRYTGQSTAPKIAGRTPAYAVFQSSTYQQAPRNGGVAGAGYTAASIPTVLDATAWSFFTNEPFLVLYGTVL